MQGIYKHRNGKKWKEKIMCLLINMSQLGVAFYGGKQETQISELGSPGNRKYNTKYKTIG